MSNHPSAATILGNLPKYVDISCVQAFDDESAVRNLAAAARAGNFVSAHVLPGWVRLLRELLADSSTLVGSPAGFPSGGSTTQAKVAEAGQLLDMGVEELDVVVNIGRLRSGDVEYVADELSLIARLVDGAVPLRAILEVGYLDDGHIRAGVECALQAGVSWIKTGTGWSGRPTEPRHVALISDMVGDQAQVKAAGGIRDLDTVRQMVALGATRFGMNATVALRLAAESARPTMSGSQGEP